MLQSDEPKKRLIMYLMCQFDGVDAVMRCVAQQEGVSRC